MNHLNPPTPSALTSDLLSVEVSSNPGKAAAQAAFRRARAAAADERSWRERLPLLAWVTGVVREADRCLAALARHSDQAFFLVIAFAGIVAGAYAGCSGPARAERYAIGPDPDATRQLMPKPAPRAYAWQDEDAGPLVASR